MAPKATDVVTAETAALKAEIEALKAKLAAKPPVKLSLKVSQKGAVSLYGMGRWPVTLYKSQWEALLGHAEQIKAFLAANADKLSIKADE